MRPSRGRRLSRIGDDNSTDGFDDFLAPKQAIKPADQLELTDQELKEEFTRVLTANNPHAPANIVRYSFKEQQYKPIPHVDQVALHYTMEGNLIHVESEDAKRQVASTKDVVEEEVTDSEQDEEEEEETFEEPKDDEQTEGDGEEEGEKADKEGAEDDQDEGIEVDKSAAKPAKKEKQKKTKKVVRGAKVALHNQFNFCDRAGQTYNNPSRERGNMTEPPPRATFAGNVTQWHIFDSYADDQEKLQEKSTEGKSKTTPKHESSSRKYFGSDSQGNDFSRIKDPIKILERMVNQNTDHDVIEDYKYYEDASDEYRAPNGTLLPLWRFSHDKSSKFAVTSVVWSMKYHDLYAVSYGSYDFEKQHGGMICLYSLKNASYPEYIYHTQSGVLSLDMHPEYSEYICAGLYDGSVLVFNLTLYDKGKREAISESSASSGKHTDPVWQVRWQSDDLDNNKNFFSVSADGRICLWTLIKKDLHVTEILKLDHSELPTSIDNLDGGQNAPYCAGTCMDFHKKVDHMFLVGTEEGKVYKCSKAYSSKFMAEYVAHQMAVYQVVWNPYHPDIFITCSADWTVKIWDHNKSYPIFTYDLGAPVGDVAWAPYSSTVFAACTTDGKVFVYDLNVNKYEPLCEQVVCQKKKASLTHISFNPKSYIIVTGDDKGHSMSFRLSPNLRKQKMEKKGVTTEVVTGPEIQIEKIEALLALVG